MSALLPLSVKIESETRDRLGRLARARHRSSDDLMREAITQYVEREERRESFLHDAERAWARYRDTGPHVTRVEMDAWLDRLASGEDVEPPECHS